MLILMTYRFGVSDAFCSLAWLHVVIYIVTKMPQIRALNTMSILPAHTMESEPQHMPIQN